MPGQQSASRPGAEIKVLGAQASLPHAGEVGADMPRRPRTADQRTRGERVRLTTVRAPTPEPVCAHLAHGLALACRWQIAHSARGTARRSARVSGDAAALSSRKIRPYSTMALREASNDRKNRTRANGGGYEHDGSDEAKSRHGIHPCVPAQSPSDDDDHRKSKTTDMIRGWSFSVKGMATSWNRWPQRRAALQQTRGQRSRPALVMRQQAPCSCYRKNG